MNVQHCYIGRIKGRGRGGGVELQVMGIGMEEGGGRREEKFMGEDICIDT